MSVTMARAGRRHVGAMAAILGQCRDEAAWLPARHDRRADRDAARLLLARTQVTVALRRRRVIGFLAMQGSAIQALYVSPLARRLGLGRDLVGVAKARSDRLELWTHQANRIARDFYARQGFYVNRLSNGEANDDRLPDMHLIWQARSDTAPDPKRWKGAEVPGNYALQDWPSIAIDH